MKCLTYILSQHKTVVPSILYIVRPRVGLGGRLCGVHAMTGLHRSVCLTDVCLCLRCPGEVLACSEVSSNLSMFAFVFATCRGGAHKCPSNLRLSLPSLRRGGAHGAARVRVAGVFQCAPLPPHGRGPGARDTKNIKPNKCAFGYGLGPPR